MTDDEALARLTFSEATSYSDNDGTPLFSPKHPRSKFSLIKWVKDLLFPPRLSPEALEEMKACHTQIRCNCMAVNVRPPITMCEVENLVRLYEDYVRLVGQSPHEKPLELTGLIHPWDQTHEVIFRRILL